MNGFNGVPLVSKDGDYFKQLKETTCPYCGVGCGVEVQHQIQLEGHKLADLKGIAAHPANHGKLCVKGSHLLDTLKLDNRLLSPSINGQQVDWDTATQDVANRLANTIEQYGPDSVAFYVSGQLLTEDYYVANKFIKGFLGTSNIDTNSRLCMSSAVAAYKRAFGADAVPCSYEDLERTNLLILIGSNAAWTHPVLFQRMERAKKLNPHMRIVVIDPRQTASCSIADLHLQLKPGSDAAIFNGLLNFLSVNNQLNHSYIAQHTEGFEHALSEAANWSVNYTADYCVLEDSKLKTFYEWFSESKSAVSFYSMGINQSSSGVDKANSIINCHLATGKIGRVGSGPFSITGQPNAMGGREVGGLANLLAAHMDFGNPEHEQTVAQFWGATNMSKGPGLKAVDLFNAIDEGKVKFVWIMATNPVVSMPNRDLVERALSQCEHVIVSDVVNNTDTVAYANVLLPACGWSEKDGTVTNSERRISRQRALIKPSGEARPDWKIICDVASKMGFSEYFSFSSPAQVFDEHARLTAQSHVQDRVFDLSGLVGLSEDEYEHLSPIQWPVNSTHPNGCERLFVDGRFCTPSKKAQFIPIRPRQPEQLTTHEFPYILNSGRLRDQWHTMTRTGNAPKLLNHSDEPCLVMSASDAQDLKLDNGDLVKLTAQHNSSKNQKLSNAILPVKIDEQVLAGHLFAPIHWSKSWGSHFTLGALFSGANDPISGQPELKHGAVALSKVTFAHYAQFSVRNPINAARLASLFEYWQVIPNENATTYLVASNNENIKTAVLAAVEYDEMIGSQLNHLSSDLLFLDSTLTAILWQQPLRARLPLDWVNHVFAKHTKIENETGAILRGEPSVEFQQGPTICSCFNVRQKVIEEHIQQGYGSVESLGQVLKCGTNCGSCRSEIGRLVAQTTVS